MSQGGDPALAHTYLQQVVPKCTARRGLQWDTDLPIGLADKRGLARHLPSDPQGLLQIHQGHPPCPVPEVGQHQVQYPLPFLSLPSSIQGSEVLTPQGAELPGDSLKWVVVPGICEVRCPGPNQGLAHNYHVVSLWSW